MKKSLLLLIACLQLVVAFSQAPQHWTSADMFLALRKLNVLGSVLYVAAHPDDVGRGIRVLHEHVFRGKRPVADLVDVIAADRADAV